MAMKPVKTITYKYDDMQRAGQLLNVLQVNGVNQARILAEIGNILDAGTIGKIFERENENKVKESEGDDKNGIFQ